MLETETRAILKMREAFKTLSQEEQDAWIQEVYSWIHAAMDQKGYFSNENSCTKRSECRDDVTERVSNIIGFTIDPYFEEMYDLEVGE